MYVQQSPSTRNMSHLLPRLSPAATPRVRRLPSTREWRWAPTRRHQNWPRAKRGLILNDCGFMRHHILTESGSKIAMFSGRTVYIIRLLQLALDARGVFQNCEGAMSATSRV